MVYEIGFTTVLCNISQDYISDLAECMLRSDDEDFGLECLGVMGNLTIPDLDYELILREYELVPWIKQKLQPGIIVFFVFSVLRGHWFFHPCHLQLQRISIPDLTNETLTICLITLKKRSTR